MAYDFGIRDLWIVNVGDIATQEFPLSFFLDLAYDFEKWGTNAINKTDLYTKQWIEKQFTGVFREDQLDKVFELLTGYTKIGHNRRPEHMNANVYHPVNYQETDNLLEQIEYLLNLADELYNSVTPEKLPTYFALVYYPAVANLNLQKMWLLTGKNNADAKLGKMEASKYVEPIKECMKRDRELVEEYHMIDDGKWYGMGLSEHIGFIHWNEDECKYPILMNALPASKPRLLVSIDGTSERSEGSPWHKNKLYLNDFMQPHIKEASITISSISELDAEYKITCKQQWLTCSKTSGSLDGKEKTSEVIHVKIDRSTMNDETEGQIVVETPVGACTIIINASQSDFSDTPEMTFIDTNGYISIEAEHFALNKEATSHQGGVNRFEVLHGYGKTLSAVKAFPTTEYFTIGEDAPYLEYHLIVQEAGVYEVELYLQPSNPVSKESTIFCGIQVNGDDINKVNTLPEGYRVDGEHWGAGVLDNIRRKCSIVNCKEGLNKLRIYAVSPGFVLEKLVIYPEGKKPADSYLGPTETYFVGK